ncbi:hypothetical protein CS063_08575 [Sporanaerobium hydrogeniformans]|uniref:Uncharacterized protein n=1 Tax=Sporanaerobium hydrogeniformans TaxID=3072179 RepID=A0AC61DDP2_9FIRM|nr:YibE/F family protein [Sporanaerobium hydrogeniformans]PHV70811.1 hypothetical protein CS063_08575 [Sporanaerobium hydrogeniformans]
MKKILMDKNRVFSLVCLTLIVALMLVPTGFEKQMYFNAEAVKAEVLSTNESTIYETGLIKQGAQTCQIRIMQGRYKGVEVEATNLLTGKLEFDKLFRVGDKAFVLLEKGEAEEILFANMIDYYRIDKEIVLALVFAVALIVFSGSIGVRTIMSFIFSLLCIWKLLIPMLLKGYHPMLISLLIGVTMAMVTLILVAGFTKKAYCAILGATCASFMTCFMAIIFGNWFQIHGAVMPWSESILYAGYSGLNLTMIYQAAIYLSCSGAIVDLAIDISAAIDEIVDKKPHISSKEILLSGLNIGKSVVGSQATTLLLAYMGSFIGIMMVYMAQGTPLLHILTSQSIAAEIVHTFVGCIGLVIVSPLTALICSRIYTSVIEKNF